MPPTLGQLEALAFDIYDACRREFPEGGWKSTTWETISPASKDSWVLIAQDVLAQSADRLLAQTAGTNQPVAMLLTCPSCNVRHIDEGEFATKAHHTHACQHCGMCWRPAIVATVGVTFLPGFKNPVQCGIYLPKTGRFCTLPRKHEGDCNA